MAERRIFHWLVELKCSCAETKVGRLEAEDQLLRQYKHGGLDGINLTLLVEVFREGPRGALPSRWGAVLSRCDVHCSGNAKAKKKRHVPDLIGLFV